MKKPSGLRSASHALRVVSKVFEVPSVLVREPEPSSIVPENVLCNRHTHHATQGIRQLALDNPHASVVARIVS